MASIRRRTRADGATTFQVRQVGAQTKTFVARTVREQKIARSDAERYRLDLERRRLLGSLYEAPAESFGALLDGYLDRREALGLRDSTRETLDQVAAYLKPLRPVLVSSLRRPEVEDLLAQLAKRAPRRAQMATRLVKATLHGAIERGQSVDESILRIPPPRYDERPPRFLTVKQLFAVAAWMPEYLRRIVPVAALTGMRQGELFDLRDADLELDEAKLWVRRGKTKAARRRVDLSGEVVSLLREQLLARPIEAGGVPKLDGLGRRAHNRGPASRLDFPTIEAGDHGHVPRAGGRANTQAPPASRLVFPTPTGLRWERNRFMHREFRPAVAAAGLKGVTFHDLRHTYASLMLRAGVDPLTVAKQMGHVDGRLVLQRYGHLYDDAGARGARALDVLLAAEGAV